MSLISLIYFALLCVLFAIVLVANLRQRFAAPLQLFSMAFLGLAVGEGASLLFARFGSLSALDVSPGGLGAPLFLLLALPALRLLLRSAEKTRQFRITRMLPCLLAALPALRLYLFHELDAAFLFTLGYCILLGLVLFFAILCAETDELRGIGWGMIIYAIGEAALFLLGPLGLLPLEAPELAVWLGRHLLLLAGLAILALSIRRHVEENHG